MARFPTPKRTKEQIEDLQNIYDCIVSSIHNVSRALSLNRNAMVKSLGEDVYSRLLTLEEVAKKSMKG